MKVSSVFDKMTYWNLETPPNSDDTIVMAMDWPDLAEAVSCFFPLLDPLIEDQTKLCLLVINI